jgi:hypothetical protein
VSDKDALQQCSSLDACLPLLRKDYERFLLLDRSLKAHLPDLRTCWVVVADSEYDELKGCFEKPYQVIPESLLAPEIDEFRRLAFPRTEDRQRRHLLGWYIQQIAKLAIAERVETTFYLTLDADVQCIRPTRYDELVRDGRAVVNTEPEDWHPAWYRRAEQILGYQRSGVNYGVTPSLLNRDGVLRLQGYLFERGAAENWRLYLMRNTPWTEYTLYHTFLEGAGLWDRYHIRGGVYDVNDARACHWDQGTWDPQKAIESGAPFVVVQSNTGIPVETVRAQSEIFFTNTLAT